jgi:hypothetical protein
MKNNEIIMDIEYGLYNLNNYLKDYLDRELEIKFIDYLENLFIIDNLMHYYDNSLLEFVRSDRAILNNLLKLELE